MRDTHRAVLYNYPGRSPQTACRAQPFTGRTLAAQGRKPRRLPQPSVRRAVNLREYSKHRFLPKAYCLRGRRRKAAFILAPQGAHLASAACLYNSLGRQALNLPVRRSRSQAEPWQPRGESPGGCLNPRGEAASTFGNTAKRRFITKSPPPQMIRTAKKH